MSPPVRPEDGATLAGMYHGDLRNFLRLLQDAVLRGAIGGASPLEPTRILHLMGQEHVRTMYDALGATSWIYVRRTVLGEEPTGTSSAPLWVRFRQVDAAERCGISAPAIRRYIEQWRDAGLVAFDREEGRSEWWRLTGTAAVGFAALLLDAGRDIAPLLAGAGPPTALVGDIAEREEQP